MTSFQYNKRPKSRPLNPPYINGGDFEGIREGEDRDEYLVLLLRDKILDAGRFFFTDKYMTIARS